MADLDEDFFYTAGVESDAFWKAVGQAFRQARESRDMDERAVKSRGRGPSKSTVEAIDKGERVQTVKLDEYARAIRYPIATIFQAAYYKLTPAALLLSQQLDAISPELRDVIMKLVEAELRLIHRHSPPAS